MSVPASTLTVSPITFAYAKTSFATAAWVFPTNAAQTQFQFPGSNTRQIVILNTGKNPILFGLQAFPNEAALPAFATLALGVPYAFPPVPFPLAAGGAFSVVEGNNCTRIPVGASYSIDLLPFQERGNFSPLSGLLAKTAYPCYLIFFGATGAGLDSECDITYVNKLGSF